MNGKSRLPSKTYPWLQLNNLLPPAPPAPPAAVRPHQRVQGPILISWDRAQCPVCGQAEIPARLCAASHPPSTGELGWVSPAGENTTALAVRNLKGALLPKQRKKISSKHWDRNATHTASINQWSQCFSIDFPFNRKSVPFRSSLESTTGVLEVTYQRRPTSAFYEKHTREADVGMMLKYFENASNCNFCFTKSFIATEDRV